MYRSGPHGMVGGCVPPSSANGLTTSSSVIRSSGSPPIVRARFGLCCSTSTASRQLSPGYGLLCVEGAAAATPLLLSLSLSLATSPCFSSASISPSARTPPVPFLVPTPMMMLHIFIPPLRKSNRVTWRSGVLGFPRKETLIRSETRCSRCCRGAPTGHGFLPPFSPSVSQSKSKRRELFGRRDEGSRTVRRC